MDKIVLQRQFDRIGAWLEVGIAPLDDWRFAGRWWRRDRSPRSFLLDVRSDKRGEVFDLTIRQDAYDVLDIVAVDVCPELRHLLLLVCEETAEYKRKFLCGHDERHWFVAAMPDNRSVKSVHEAMDALKPQAVLDARHAHQVRPKNWNRRRSAGFVRQGEWFFVPSLGFEPDNPELILHDEPIQRSGGTPHVVEMLYRRGGETVYVGREYPAGLTECAYERLIARDPAARHEDWRLMRRNPEVYAMGEVRHPDHKTVILPFWHHVLMSGESRSKNVAFLD
jgi:hypothetical protein